MKTYLKIKIHTFTISNLVSDSITVSTMLLIEFLSTSYTLLERFPNVSNDFSLNSINLLSKQ